MSFSSIPGVYEGEQPCLALWSIGHGPSIDYTRVVFRDTQSDYLIRYGLRPCGSCWEISQAKLPSPTYGGIIERLELLTIPLVAKPQGAYLDSAEPAAEPLFTSRCPGDHAALRAHGR